MSPGGQFRASLDMCRLPNGKRHSHQRRIPSALLREIDRRLQTVASDLAGTQDFSALLGIVEREIGQIHGVGELTVYDVAHRVGAFLGKAPALVYLHRGTREGARHLGFMGKAIDPRMLPPAFNKLTPAEVEDCLCIYKAELHGAPSNLKKRCGQTSPQRSRC